MKQLYCFLCFLLFSSLSFADSLTLRCPDLNQLKLINNQWHGVIPSTKTSAGFVIKEINLVGPYNGKLTIPFGVGRGIINGVSIIDCSYSDESMHNSSDLSGNLDKSGFSKYFKVTDCRINIKMNGLYCSN